MSGLAIIKISHKKYGLPEFIGVNERQGLTEHKE